MCHFSHFTSIFSRSGPHAKRCWSVEVFWKAANCRVPRSGTWSAALRYLRFASLQLQTALLTANCCKSPLAMRSTLTQSTHCISIAQALYWTSTVLQSSTVLHWIYRRTGIEVCDCELARADCVIRTILGQVTNTDFSLSKDLNLQKFVGLLNFLSLLVQPNIPYFCPKTCEKLPLLPSS